MNRSDWVVFIGGWVQHRNTHNVSLAIFLNDTSAIMYAFFEIYQTMFFLYLVVGGFICLFGTVSNLVCIAAICTYPPLRRRGNVLVANFVFLNLVLSATVYPISLVSLSCRHYCTWPHDNCQWAIFYYLILHSVTWQECLLALNRFVAIMLPYHYRTVSTKRAVIFSIFLGYLIPFALNIPTVGTVIPTYSATLPFGGCLYNRYGNGTFQLIHSIIGVYVPMTIVGSAYSAIFVRVGLSRYAQRHEPSIRQSSSMKRRLILAKMLFASFIWYCLTYLPHPIMTAALPAVYCAYPTTYFYARWALFAGAGMNAVVYACTNKEYRQGIAFVLKRRVWREINPEVELVKDGIKRMPIVRDHTTCHGETGM